MSPPLKFGTKVAYGVGQFAEGIKNNIFEWFLFFYFTSVLGLSGTLAGVAMFIAVLFDAVTDPLAGSLSDNSKHRWGRRHPFMYASAIPLALTFAALFSPPEGIGQTGLFLWLTAGAVLVRASMTLYHVPHLALGAELTDDYQGRTAVVGYRLIFGVGGQIFVAILAWRMFFVSTTEFPEGQNNPDAYPGFAVFFAAMMAFTIFISAFGTQSRVPHLPKAPEHPEPLSARRVFGELAGALKNRSFRYLFTGLVIFFVTRGVQTVLALHVFTYFWEVEAKTLQRAVVLTFALGVPAWAIISRFIDKKPTLLTGVIGFTIFNLVPPAAAVLGWWFSRDSPYYATALTVCMALAGFCGAAGFVAAGSMLADVSDEHELITAKRQEGIFFGALSFSVKAASGLGNFIAGVALDLIRFPKQPEVGQIPEETLRWLAILYGPGLTLLIVVSLPFFFRYRLNRARHAEILRELDERRGKATAE